MKRIVGGEKDSNGAYVPKTVTSPPPLPALPQEPEKTTDDLLRRVLLTLDYATDRIRASILNGNVDRDTIGALKDCAAILKDLKKDEKEFLEGLSDEQLEAMKNEAIK